jgi:hypothetical protein
MMRHEVMAQLRYHWGDAYAFTAASGRYTDTAKFGRRDVLTAEDPEQLLRKIRLHHRPELLEERCST